MNISLLQPTMFSLPHATATAGTIRQRGNADPRVPTMASQNRLQKAGVEQRENSLITGIVKDCICYQMKYWVICFLIDSIILTLQGFILMEDIINIIKCGQNKMNLKSCPLNLNYIQSEHIVYPVFSEIVLVSKMKFQLEILFLVNVCMIIVTACTVCVGICVYVCVSSGFYIFLDK